MSKLQELLNKKRADLEARKSRTPRVPQDDRIVHFDRERFHLFAEVKRSSLSAGAIRDIDPAELAVEYEHAGASLISVLTEEHYFGGSLQDLKQVSGRVQIPVLQKDFILDPYQILEAKEAGADFVLLIARLLDSQQLQRLLRVADEIKINAIVEITDAPELQILNQSVKYLGVNSRDLDSLRIDTGKFARLRALLPDDCFLLAESGINSLALLREVLDLGYHAALIGEHFLRAANPAKELSVFAREAELYERNLTRIKICGITNFEDAQRAIEAGADALGFVFAHSPRKINPDLLTAFRAKIPSRILTIGVFKDQSADEVLSVAKKCALDLVQVYDSMDLPCRSWQAKTIRSADEIHQETDSHKENILWDIKAERDQLPAIWRELSRKNVFALAGGLDPENISDAIATCHPRWVDVARGVEKQPGIKDEKKLQGFITAARRASGD